MTTEPEKTPEPAPVDPPAPKQEPEKGTDRLPDDHPVVIALNKANKEAETARLKVKEYEDRDLTEQQKLEQRAVAAEERAEKAERERMRLKAAVAAGLDDDLADRIKGDSEEDLLADAQRLAAKYGNKRPPSFDGGPRTPPPIGDGENGDMNQAIRRALGKSQ